MTTRSPEVLIAAIASLAVETNPAYQPGHLVAGSTWCNRFVSDVTSLLGCPVPFLVANQQLEYLKGIDGAADGWFELEGPVRHLVAIDKAERGIPVIAVWGNSVGHGHIAILRPALLGKMFIAQAGATNFSSGPIGKGFGDHPFRLFNHL